MNIPADHLDLAAVRQANEKLWASHPELNRRQLTLDKSDTACRQEWMQQYQQALSSPKPSVPAPKTMPEPALLPAPASASPTAECPVGEMTHEEKMEQAIRMADLPAGVREAIGDPKTLVATFAICMGIMIAAGAATAATGVGAIAEVVGAILLLGGAALAGYQIGTGMMQLYDFYEKTRCDRAKSYADLNDAGHDFASGVSNMGVGAFMLFLSMAGAKGKSWRGKALPEETVRVYRVEGTGNQRIIIDAEGNIEIPEVLTRKGAERNLYLNFGDEARAQEFLKQRLEQFPDNNIKSFEVPKSFVEELRANAVSEAERSAHPSRPVVADPTKADNQFGLSKEQIEQLRRIMLKGSGNSGD